MNSSRRSIPGRRMALPAGVGALLASVLAIGLLAAPTQAAFSAPFSLSGQDVNGPKVVNDADGNAIAVWSQFDGAKYAVRARQVSATGALGPVKTLSASAEKPVYPQIAGDGKGGAVVVWSQFNGVTTRVKARRISADGRLGALKALSGRRKTARPRVASDKDGNAIAVWSEGGAGASRIKARKIRSSGKLGQVHTLSGRRKEARDPAIASDARGDAIVVWSQRGGSHPRITDLSGVIKARRISAKGRLGSPKTLSDRGHDAGQPQVASDAHGNAVAVWTRLDADGKHERIQARRISAKGGLGSGKTLATGNPDTPQIASNARGDMTVVWAVFGGDRGGAQARQISAAGAVGPLQILSAQRGVTFPPEVGIDGAGDASVIWSIDQFAAGRHVEARQIYAPGMLGPLEDISSAEGIRDADIAVNGAGDAIGVWSQLRGSSWRVWGSLNP